MLAAPEKHVDRRNEEDGNMSLKEENDNQSYDSMNEFNNIMITRENSKTPLPKAIASHEEDEAGGSEDNS